MAQIPLPNGANWEDTAPFLNQTQEAQCYALDTIRYISATVVTEEDCQDSGVMRPTEVTHNDTGNSLLVRVVTEYVEDRMAAACKAVKDQTITVETTA